MPYPSYKRNSEVYFRYTREKRRAAMRRKLCSAGVSIFFIAAASLTALHIGGYWPQHPTPRERQIQCDLNALYGFDMYKECK